MKFLLGLTFIVLSLILQIKSTHPTLMNAVTHDTAIFLHKFVNKTNSQMDHGKCGGLLIEFEKIYNFSFALDNNFGDFTQCVHNQHMVYYYIQLIEKNYKAAWNSKLSFYYKKLIFTNYISFGLCVPKCIKISDNILVNVTELVDNPDAFEDQEGILLLRSHIITESYQSTGVTLILLSIILGVFSFVCIFFSIFPNYDSIQKINCCHKKSKIYTKSFQTEESEIKCENEKVYKKRKRKYKFISSIFNISKNINRFFKQADKHNCFTNDHSLAFINGLRAINLFIFSFCAIFWIMIECPNLNINIYNLKSKIIDTGILPFISCLYTSIIFRNALAGFSLSYKLLSCLNKYESNGQDKESLWNRLFYFSIPLISRYIFYIVLILVVYNMNTIMSGLNDEKGPLMKIYEEDEETSLSYIFCFIFLWPNLTINQEFRRNSIFFYFFMFIVEFYSLLICFILLLVYYKKPKIGISLFIFTFLINVLLRTLMFAASVRDLRDIFGFDVNLFINMLNGFPIYLLGAFSGIMYFEYNNNSPFLQFNGKDIDQTFYYLDFENFKNSTNNASSIPMLSHHPDLTLKMKSLFKEYSPVKLWVNKYARSNWLQNSTIIISLLFLILFFGWDCLFLFGKIMENPFYEFNLFEKVYVLFELEAVVFFVFALVFKFAIFQDSFGKWFLESHKWIVVARSFNIIVAFLSPLTYFSILSQSYPLEFDFFYTYCMSISILVLIMICGWGIIIIIEIPLKVGFKKITKKYMKNKLKEV